MTTNRTYPGAQVPADVAKRLLTELGEMPAEEQAQAFDRFSELYARARRPTNDRDELTRANLQL